MSEFDAFIRFDSGDHHIDYAPDDALQTRLVFNNLNHLSEQSAQVLVCSPHPQTITATGTGTDTLRRVIRYGPLRVRVRPDGSSYRIRNRINLRLVTSSTVDVYLSVHPVSEFWFRSVDAARPNSAKITLTSTTAAWYEFGDDGILWMPPDSVTSAETRRATLDDLSGNESSVFVTEAMLSLFIVPPVTTVNVEVRSFYAAEFYGVE